MGENYNTGTCTIRIGRDYVCLNFGSNLAASASVRDRGTSERVPGGRACSVTVPNTNCMANPLPRSFSGREASINCAARFTRCFGRSRPSCQSLCVVRLLFSSGSTRCVTHLLCPIFLKREGENSYRMIYSEVSLSVPC